jgi:hypothetical protein
MQSHRLGQNSILSRVKTMIIYDVGIPNPREKAAIRGDQRGTRY